MARTIIINDGGKVHHFNFGATDIPSTPALAVEINNKASRQSTEQAFIYKIPTIVVESGQKVICHPSEQPSTSFAVTLGKYEERASQSKMTRLISRFKKKGTGYEPVTPLPTESPAKKQFTVTKLAGKVFPSEIITVSDINYADEQATAAALALLDLNKGNKVPTVTPWGPIYNTKGQGNIKPAEPSPDWEICYLTTSPSQPPDPEVQIIGEKKVCPSDEVQILSNVPITNGRKDKKTRVTRNTVKPYNIPSSDPTSGYTPKAGRNKGIKTLVQDLNKPYGARPGESRILNPQAKMVLGRKSDYFTDSLEPKTVLCPQTLQQRADKTSTQKPCGEHLVTAPEIPSQSEECTSPTLEDILDGLSNESSARKIAATKLSEALEKTARIMNSFQSKKKVQNTDQNKPSEQVTSDPDQITPKSSPHYKAIRSLFQLYRDKGKLCKKIRDKWYLTDIGGRIHYPSLDEYFDKTKHSPKYTHLELLETARSAIFETREAVEQLRTRHARMPEGEQKKANSWLLEAAEQEIGHCLLLHHSAQGPLGRDFNINQLRHIMVKMLAFLKLIQGVALPNQLVGYTQDLIAHQNKMACDQIKRVSFTTPVTESVSSSSSTPAL